MSAIAGLLRRQLAGVVGLALVVTMFFVVRLPQASAGEREELASKYAFTPLSFAMPGGGRQQDIRKVNRAYKDIDAWISSVGAAIALNDISNDGLSNDACITDTRTDRVVVTPAPGKGGDRYEPFVLDPAPLPMAGTVAPMGCAAGDFNEDGRMDLLVYYWGRAPVVFLADPDAKGLSADAFRPVELLAGDHASGGRYTGPQWNTNAIAIDDFDADGHVDIMIGNYFPDSPVLDDTVDGGVVMNRSLSKAANGGENHFFRWTGGSGDSVNYEHHENVLPEEISKGWILGAASADLDGDLKPELYIANDHGQDALMHNRSTPGRFRFAPVKGTRYPTVPKSKQVGNDSFKGMGVDFADLDNNGLYDFFVSNITTSFGIQESNLQFMSTAKSRDEIRRALGKGRAPWEDRSADLGTAWVGWGWDVKAADFDNDGDLEIAQANGFVKGEVNRWPVLQELAAANDEVLANPKSWPKVRKGDDIAGNQRMHFFAKEENGRYVNLSDELGLAVPIPTRGVAVADTDGDGRLEFAMARQFGPPAFYQNESRSPGRSLELRLSHAGTPGSPVVGAEVTATLPDGRKHVTRVDGGGGHSGKRGHDVHIGLGGEAAGPIQVNLRWRDRAGTAHEQDLQLSPGRHSLLLGSEVRKEER